MWPFDKKHLPFTNGPYIPGCVDFMTGYSKNGVFVRLYYPTSEKTHIKNFIDKWIPWIPDDSYFRGFARVVMLWVLVIRIIIWLMSGKLYIPAIYGAKPHKDRKLKCLVFSHGLGGCRFLYSKTCIELASHGFLVVAAEHRDESACNTYYYESVNDVQNDNKTFITYAPVKLGANHYFIRNAQVQLRSEECKKILNLLKDINSGADVKNILEDLPNSKDIDFKTEDLKDLLEIDDISIVGHSFGAATSLMTLANNKEIKRGIILDPWMFPLKDMEDVIKGVNQPLIFINTQTFQILSNLKIMEKFVDANPEQRPVYTILHTTHESQTDTVFVFGYWLNWFMKKLSAGNAMEINNSLIICYLNKQCNFPKNVDDCEQYLLNEAHNIATGLPALKSLAKM